ncbi:hypothetical protein MTP99_009090 [Tenebrio molitor]|jgi:hypothetical protein|nr:hypothetical protein MTP99_009090 [Tenebrio molitor]
MERIFFCDGKHLTCYSFPFRRVRANIFGSAVSRTRSFVRKTGEPTPKRPLSSRESVRKRSKSQLHNLISIPYMVARLSGLSPSSGQIRAASQDLAVHILDERQSTDEKCQLCLSAHSLEDMSARHSPPLTPCTALPYAPTRCNMQHHRTQARSTEEPKAHAVDELASESPAYCGRGGVAPSAPWV